MNWKDEKDKKHLNELGGSTGTGLIDAAGLHGPHVMTKCSYDHHQNYLPFMPK